MNALPASSVPIARSAQPRAEPHRVVVMVDLNRAAAPAALTRCWHLVTIPVSRAPSHIPFLTRGAYGVFAIPAFLLGVEIVPLLKISALAAKASSSRGFVLENPPTHVFHFK